MGRLKPAKTITLGMLIVGLVVGGLSDETFAQPSIKLLSARVNGRNVALTRTIVVNPGEPLSGELRIRASYGGGPQSSIPVAATPNWKWGSFVSNSQIYTEVDTAMPSGVHDYSYVLPEGLTAPAIPGTYYIGIFSGLVSTSQQLMSCDGFPWDDPALYFWDGEGIGDPAAPDIANWPGDFWEQVFTEGTVENFPFCSEDQCTRGVYVGVAVRVVVAPSAELVPVADTFISSSTRWTWVGNEKVRERDANFGANSGLSIIQGIYAGGTWFLDWRGTLIQFDLSSIPQGAEVLSAELFLYHYNVWGQLVSIHRMLREWVELEATWYQPCAGCHPWWMGWYDGNYVLEPTDSQWVTGIDRWFSWDVTGDVESFLKGTPNFGWFLKSAHATGSDWTSTSFYSKESYERALIPRLRVHYRLPSPPEIEFSAAPESILWGETSTLSWSTAHADTVLIEPGIGFVATSGYMVVSPTVTTTYTLTASGPGGTATASATVTVSYPAPQVTISAEPALIFPGQSSTLSWTSSYADTCSIEPGIGEVPPNGSITVSPSRSTTYTITATGPGGTATASVEITVVR